MWWWWWWLHITDKCMCKDLIEWHVMSDHTSQAVDNCRQRNSTRSITIAVYLRRCASEIKHCCSLTTEYHTHRLCSQQLHEWIIVTTCIRHQWVKWKTKGGGELYIQVWAPSIVVGGPYLSLWVVPICRCGWAPSVVVGGPLALYKTWKHYHLLNYELHNSAYQLYHTSINFLHTKYQGKIIIIITSNKPNNQIILLTTKIQWIWN